MLCKNCNKSLTSDEKSLYMKIVNRQATQFLCKTCLANYFSVEESVLDQKIKQFKENGCLLFTK